MGVIGHLVAKDLLRLVRAPLAVLVMLSFPIIFSLLLGMTFGTGDVEPPKVRLLIEDLDPVSLDELEADLSETVGGLAEARDHRRCLADGRTIGFEPDHRRRTDSKREPQPSDDEDGPRTVAADTLDDGSIQYEPRRDGEFLVMVEGGLQALRGVAHHA